VVGDSGGALDLLRQVHLPVSARPTSQVTLYCVS
jgi:hypothetical protein